MAVGERLVEQERERDEERVEVVELRPHRDAVRDESHPERRERLVVLRSRTALGRVCADRVADRAGRVCRRADGDERQSQVVAVPERPVAELGEELLDQASTSCGNRSGSASSRTAFCGSW